MKPLQKRWKMLSFSFVLIHNSCRSNQGRRTHLLYIHYNTTYTATTMSYKMCKLCFNKGLWNDLKHLGMGTCMYKTKTWFGCGLDEYNIIPGWWLWSSTVHTHLLASTIRSAEMLNQMCLVRPRAKLSRTIPAIYNNKHSIFIGLRIWLLPQSHYCRSALYIPVAMTTMYIDG